MPKLIDLTGKRFGKLTVIDRAPNSKNCETMWNCLCDCGNALVVRGHNLKQGTTKSCGCSRKDKRPYRETHGMSKTRLYRIWSLMRNRCECETSRAYHNYGGRGISVCEEWLNPSNFFDWSLKNGYADNLSIDRIDNNGNYCPDNCRWVSRTVQSNNTRSNKFYTIGEKTQTLAEWCREYNISYKSVHDRIKRYGWDLKKALETPMRKRNESSKR